MQKMTKKQKNGFGAVKADVARQILTQMKRQGIRQIDLAERLETSRIYISQILQGKTNFTIESLVKISSALDLELTVRMSAKRKAK